MKNIAFSFTLLFVIVACRSVKPIPSQKVEIAKTESGGDASIFTMVKSFSSVVLFRNSANIINLQPSTIPPNRMVLRSKDAEVKISADVKSKFLIVPQQDKCKLWLSDSARPTDSIELDYVVMEPPKPSLSLWINGVEAANDSAVHRGDKAKIKIIPDPEYKSLQPVDARYEIGRIEVFLVCGDEKTQVGGADLLGQDATFEGVSLPIPTDAFKCYKDPELQFKIQDIYRKNFQGKLFKDPRFSLQELCIVINIRP